VEEIVRDLLIDFYSYVASRFVRQLTDVYSSTTMRADAVPFLGQLSIFEVSALKSFYDRDARDSYLAAIRRWQGAWDSPALADPDAVPETTDSSRSSDVEALRVARDKAVAERSRAMLELGAWLAFSIRKGDRGAETFMTFAGPVANVVPLNSVFEAVDDLASGRWEPTLLERWDTDAHVDRHAVTAWVADRDLFMFWAALLIARLVGQEELPSELHLPAWAFEALELQAEAIDESWDTWAGFIGDRERLRAERDWLREMAQKAERSDRARMEEAPLDAARTDSFEADQIKSFGKRAQVRELIRLAGRLTVRDLDLDVVTPRTMLLPRELFVAEGPLSIGAGQLGQDLAAELERTIYDVLADAAPAGPALPDPVESAIAAAEELNGETEYLAMLVPNRSWARHAFGIVGHRRFRWRERAFLDDPGGPLGYIDAIPVYEAGSSDGHRIVVADFKGAVDLSEARSPQAPTPIEIKIRTIDGTRGRELAKDRRLVSGEESGESLARRFVEVAIYFDYEVRATSEIDRFARRIEAPLEALDDSS
jgi:hypothetical protein